MGIRISSVGIDTNDVASAAEFWRAVTGYEVVSLGDDFAALVDPHKEGPSLNLQVVPEPRVGKNRVHLDLVTDDLAGEAERVGRLGGTVVHRFTDDDGGGWIVMADTEGNQFCLVAA